MLRILYSLFFLLVSDLAVNAAESPLADALEQLPQDQRRVIELRHFDELSHAAIASKLNKSEAAVRMLWVRGLRSLQKLHQQANRSQRAKDYLAALPGICGNSRRQTIGGLFVAAAPQPTL